LFLPKVYILFNSIIGCFGEYSGWAPFEWAGPFAGQKEEETDMNWKGIIGGILALIIATLIAIILSIIYFVIALFIIDVAAGIVFDTPLSTDWAVLAAALLTIGTMSAGAGLSRDAD
jgi:hypothetical protein